MAKRRGLFFIFFLLPLSPVRFPQTLQAHFCLRAFALPFPMQGPHFHQILQGCLFLTHTHLSSNFTSSERPSLFPPADTHLKPISTHSSTIYPVTLFVVFTALVIL